jgi:hypothetical protein
VKKFLTAILLVLAVLASAGTATAATWTNLNGVTTTGAGSTLAFSTTPGLQAHIYSSAGSSATVVVQGAMSSSGPWITLATATNPSATGECFQGTPFPYMRANATARASGTLYAVFRDLREDPGPWASCVAGATSTAPTYGLLKWSWTNSTITAGAGGTTLDATVGTLPGKSQPLSAYVIVDGQATFTAGTLKAGLGVAGTTYVDWIVSSDIKAAAATVYGDAAAERGTDMAIKYYATAQTVKTQFIAGAGDLANVTGSSGTVYLTYVTYP